MRRPSTKRWAIIGIPACLVVLLAMVADVTRAATPSEGTLSIASPAVAWEGDRFVAPTGCATVEAGEPSADPTCDRFLLTVDAAEGAFVRVAVLARTEGDDIDLKVYAPNGSLVGSSATGGGNEAVAFRHSPASHGAGAYRIYIVPFTVTPGSNYDGTASFTDHAVAAAPDILGDCGVPSAVEGIRQRLLDDGRDVTVDVLVLLDGIGMERARNVFKWAATAYSPLGITLRVTEYLPADFPSVDVLDIIGRARSLVGGTKPNGVDVVHVLTTKSITHGGSAVFGTADCIGGVRYPDHGFAVSLDNLAVYGEDRIQLYPRYLLGQAVIPRILGLPFYAPYQTAKTMAHEIGHLLGGQHQLANCVQGLNLTDLVYRHWFTPCTLMDTSNYTALRFSTINGAIVRGFAREYADD